MHPGLLLAGLALLLASCDTVDTGENVVLFTTVTDQLVFAFDSDDARTGQFIDVTAAQTVDLAGFLSSQGFSKAEVVAAQVESARLVMAFPIDVQTNFLNEAILKFQAAGVSATEVASQTSFPNSREVTLDVRANRDVASFITRPNFSVILQLNPATLKPSADYQMGATVRLRIEVEGV